MRRGAIPGGATLLACLGLLACAGTGTPGAGEAASGEVVRLRFDWPAPLSAGVDARVLHTDGRILRYRFALRPEPTDAGLRLRHASFAAEDPRAPGSFAALAPGSTGATVLAGLEPDLLVDAAGVLQQVDDSAVATIVDVTLAQRDARATLPRELLLEAARQRQLQRAQEIWYALVEFWVDQEYELGSSYELSIEQSLEGRPEHLEEWIGDLDVSGRMPCPSRVEGPRCIELTLTSRLADPDPARLASRIAISASDLGLDQPSPEALRALEALPVTELVQGYEEHETIRLVCEPDGLVPHALEYRRERRLEVKLPDQEIRRLDSTRETAYRFAYEPAP